MVSATDYIKDKDCTRETPVVYGAPQQCVYGTGKRIKPRIPGKRETEHQNKYKLDELLPLEAYDLFIVLLSAGKDSVAAFWKLIELGVPLEKIELWHHDIDGGFPERQMDWPVTLVYNQAFAEAVNTPLRLSWRVNGFFGELYRRGASYPIEFEDAGEIHTCRLSKHQQRSEELREQILQSICSEQELEQMGYRFKFPAKSADLSRRWCSASLKIDVASSVMTNIDWLDELCRLGEAYRFPAKGAIGSGRWCSPNLKRRVADTIICQMNELHTLGSPRHKWPAKGCAQAGRWCSGSLKAQIQDKVTTNLDMIKDNINILVVSGERRGESASRAQYNEMEVHRTNATARAKRLVHHWRAVIDYSERDIWEVYRRYGVTPHPCYSIGWSRCSCMMCIFSEPRHWAGIRELFPEQYALMVEDEKKLDHTINTQFDKATKKHVGLDLESYIGDAKSCVVHDDQKALEQTRSGEFKACDIFIAPHLWHYPAGAFKGSGGGPC